MNNGPTISIGSTGRDVRRLQRLFVMMKVLAPGNITGTFDSTTDQAVKDFQQGAGLTVDGIVGPITLGGASGRSKYAAVIPWCVGQRCDRVTKRSQEVFDSCD
jgi:peptidoglycan hydrolase-like protein with peptidoglycan-binding domain